MDMICRFWRAQQSEVFIDFWYVDCCEMFPFLKVFLCWFLSNGERNLKSKNWDSTSFIIFVVRCSKPSKFTNNIDIFTPFFPLIDSDAHIPFQQSETTKQFDFDWGSAVFFFLINYEPKIIYRAQLFFSFSIQHDFSCLCTTVNFQYGIPEFPTHETFIIYSHRAPFLCPFVL